MKDTARFLFLVGTSACLAGCATENIMPETLGTNSHAPPSAINSYALRSEELALPCNKLKGRIQLRVLEVRDRSLKRKPSAVATSMRWASDTAGLWHQQGAQSDIGSAQDIAVLTAYNKRLGQMGCPQYNIKNELNPKKSQAWKIR